MKIFPLSLIVASILFTSGVHAGVSLTKEDRDGKTLYRLDNGRVALFIDRPNADEGRNRRLLAERFGNATIPAYYVLEPE
jgi:hypothetical protein